MRAVTRARFRLAIRAEAGKAYVSYLRRWITASHALIPKTKLTELSIALVGDARMGNLHQQFMGIAGPTDVLTFPLDEEGGYATAGEVVVCVPEARRRARDEGVSVERELLLYALHGMLHLSGFDDTTRAGYRRMHATEDRILEALGIGSVFMPDKKKPRTTKRTPARRPRQ